MFTILQLIEYLNSYFNEIKFTRYNDYSYSQFYKYIIIKIHIINSNYFEFIYLKK